MKNTGKFKFITGFIAGAIIFGSLSVYAADIIAKRSTHKITVNGEPVQVEAYIINDRNYFQLKDLGNAVGFATDWDAKTSTVLINTQNVTPIPTIAPVTTPTPPPTTAPVATPTPTPQAYKVGDTITLNNATIHLIDVTTADSTPPDEYGSKLLASNGNKLLCINFDVTANSLNYNNTLWSPNQFIKYATAVSGINYEMPFSQGTSGFGANVKKTATVYIEVPANETITSITISDGTSNFAIVNVK